MEIHKYKKEKKLLEKIQKQISNEIKFKSEMIKVFEIH